MIKHVFLSATDLFYIFYLEADEADADPPLPSDFDAIEQCIMGLEHLQSLTYHCGQGYGFGAKEVEKGWIAKPGIDFIKSFPHRLLGEDETGSSDFVESYTIPPMVEAWQARGKTFKLYAETFIYDEDGQGFFMPHLRMVSTSTPV